MILPKNEKLLFPCHTPEKTILSSIKEKLKGKFKLYESNYGLGVLGDAREVLNYIQKEYFDAVITDPPFLPQTDSFTKKTYKSEMSDDLIFEIENLLFNVLRKNSWLITYWSVKNLPRAFRFKRFQYAWTICVEFHSTYSKCPIGDRKWIPVLCFKKGNPKTIMRRPDIIPAEELPIIQEKLNRPDFKPTFVNSRLIQMFLPENGIVLDPFAGWGSLPLVCEIFKKTWMGIEIDAERFNFMIEMIENFNKK